MSTQEKKNDRVGMGVSIGIHAILLILFIFLLAWKEPIPPIPEYGIELNFGLDQAGYGEVQPTTPANDSPETVEDAAPEEPAEAEQVAEESEQESEPVETDQQPEVIEEPQPTTTSEQKVTTQPTPSPTTVEEKPKEQPKVEPKKEKPKPKLNPAASYPGKNNKTDGTQGTSGTAKNPSSSNQGDRPGETGDQGDPEGSLDSRALYGKPGGGGNGAALEMSGWNWDYLPKPADTSNESGRIVFEIKIDEDGEIISVRTIEKTVSDAVVKIYRTEVVKLTFSRTSDNLQTASTSTGRITFIIKSR